MPLPVISFSTYLTSADGVAWRPDDYNARDFVLAIKGKEIAGYAFVRCQGSWRRFENTNRKTWSDGSGRWSLNTRRVSLCPTRACWFPSLEVR